jgi:beta-glucosidase
MNRLILLAAAAVSIIFPVGGTLIHPASTSLTRTTAWTTPDPRGVTWPAAHARANATLAQLTKAEKIGLVTGVGWQVGACVGNTRAVARLGVPSICMQDGPVGIRFARAGSVTVFPAGVHAAATWDRGLMRARSRALGEEARGLGIHVMLAPVAGPLGRHPRGGRNWEGFSPDPYLTGKAMEESVVGMQEVGVQANAKHFIGNEQVCFRSTGAGERG